MKIKDFVILFDKNLNRNFTIYKNFKANNDLWGGEV